ncbi:MAG: DUF4232 domain-containing protein [Chloroflexi bacterium]|nr:MAG: DUF4232 domain-containing protein [Chloroflexota bacterium]
MRCWSSSRCSWPPARRQDPSPPWRSTTSRRRRSRPRARRRRPPPRRRRPPPPPPPGRAAATRAACRSASRGTIVDTFRVANTQTSACTLYGYVGMLMLDGSGGSMPTRVVRNGGIWSTEAGPSQFLLQPGTAASFRAAWSDVPHGSETTCAQAARLEITPPDEFDHVTIPVTGWNMAPCNAGEIDVTPIRAAGVP